VIDEQVGEKGKKVVYYVYYVPKSPNNLLRSLPVVLAYLFPNFPELFPQYEARKGDPKPCLEGEYLYFIFIHNCRLAQSVVKIVRFYRKRLAGAFPVGWRDL